MKKPKIFYGWWIVAAVFLIAAYANGIVVYSFTAVLEPIVDKFGWSFTQVSFAASIRGVESAFLAPVIGFLFDRLGPRRLIFAAGVMIGVGLILLSRVNSIAMFYGAFFLMASGISACAGLILSTVVGYWFRKSMSLATGIVVSGGAFGGVLVPLATRLIDTLTYQKALLIFGLAAWGIILPLSLVVRHKPEQYGYLPYGEEAGGEKIRETIPTESSIPGHVPVTNLKISEVLKSRVFWQISLGVMCHLFVANSVTTHIMPYLGSIEIPRTTASLVASALPLMSILGRLSFGWFGDKYDRRRVTVAGFILTILGVWLLTYVNRGLWIFAPFVIIYGLGWGGVVPMVPAMLHQHFGRSRLGTILGLCLGVMMIGNIIGPPLTGWIYDTYGSYLGAWYVGIGVLVAGMICLASIPMAKKRETGILNHQ
jgi:MFS family permease